MDGDHVSQDVSKILGRLRDAEFDLRDANSEIAELKHKVEALEGELEHATVRPCIGEGGVPCWGRGAHLAGWLCGCGRAGARLVLVGQAVVQMITAVGRPSCHRPTRNCTDWKEKRTEPMRSRSWT